MSMSSSCILQPSIMSSRSMPSISWVKTCTSWVKLEIKLRISSDPGYVHANPSGFELYSIWSYIFYCTSVHQHNQRLNFSCELQILWSSVLWNPELLVNSPSTTSIIAETTKKIQKTHGCGWLMLVVSAHWNTPIPSWNGPASRELCPCSPGQERRHFHRMTGTHSTKAA